MSNYTLRLRRKTNYTPQVEGVKMPSEGGAGGFNSWSGALERQSHPLDRTVACWF